MLFNQFFQLIAVLLHIIISFVCWSWFQEVLTPKKDIRRSITGPISFTNQRIFLEMGVPLVLRELHQFRYLGDQIYGDDGMVPFWERFLLALLLGEVVLVGGGRLGGTGEGVG